MERTQEDYHETQRFTIWSILVSHCGQILSPDKVDEISSEIKNAMRDSSTSWAFDVKEHTHDK